MKWPSKALNIWSKLSIFQKPFKTYNIPTKIIKENMDIISNIFFDNINQCFSKSFFPDGLKRAEVIPVFKKDIKKDSKNWKQNYRPVSILSNISKIYETCLYNELSSYFVDIFQIISLAFPKVLVLSNAWPLLLKPGKNILITMSLFGYYWLTSLRVLIV